MASVWGGTKLSFEERCQILAKIGFKGVDLPTAQQVPILKKFGLAPTMMTGTGTSFQDGLIRKELHDKFEAAFRAGIDMCAELGCPNLIALPGERRGMSREEGADNAVAILNRVKGYAEQKNVTLCMEITNSKVAADQRTDQIFDHLDWGLDVCRTGQFAAREDRLRHLSRADHGSATWHGTSATTSTTSATSTSPAFRAAWRSTTRRSSTTASSPTRSRRPATPGSSPTSSARARAAIRSRASSSASRS